MSVDQDAIRDELAGWPIGSGYYQMKVSVEEARDMASALIDDGGPLAALVAGAARVRVLATSWAETFENALTPEGQTLHDAGREILHALGGAE